MMRSLAVLALTGLASSAVAAERPDRLTPVLGEAAVSQATPTLRSDADVIYAPSTGGTTVMPAPKMVTPMTVTPTLVLYSNVRVKDTKNIAPCAIPRIVQVADPCNPGCLVNVEVCVPPCACECVKVSRCGTKVKLDYGKYEVEITSRRGQVVVDYDD